MLGDLVSALLSDALQVTEGAPSPPALHPNPMLDFYKGLCSDDIGLATAAGATMCWEPGTHAWGGGGHVQHYDQ